MAFSFRLKLLRLKYILPGEIAVPICGYGKIIRQTDPILRNQNNEYFIIACKSLCFLNCIIIYNIPIQYTYRCAEQQFYYCYKNNLCKRKRAIIISVTQLLPIYFNI